MGVSLTAAVARVVVAAVVGGGGNANSFDRGHGITAGLVVVVVV